MRVRSAILVLAAMAVVAGTACSPSREEASTIPAGATTTGSVATTPATTAAEASEQPTSAASSPTAADQQVIRVNVTAGQVTPAPAPVEVPLGSTVVIELTSDVDDEIHVHGYDLTAPVAAGQPSRFEVKATIAGQFEVELHNDELQLFTLRVQ